MPTEAVFGSLRAGARHDRTRIRFCVMEPICFVQTIREHCRVCYTCVRECPAKAIRIADGQAQVIGDRCIACGNCLRVCSQGAKQVYSSIPDVEALLASGQKVAACVAPSFPAEFTDTDARQMVGMLWALGFNLVNEVAFGADLVAREYRRLLAECNGRRFITTTCPAIVGYIERYHPDLVDSLSPIVSPMIATARALRELHGKDLKVVFIGPCIAKKAEARSKPVAGEIDAVLTFPELRQMLGLRNIRPDNVEPCEFDPPHGASGAMFPVSRGILQAADIREDLMTGEVVATAGRTHTLEAIKEFATGDLGAKLLEVLACEGCIMGAGITNDLPLFNRRRHMRKYFCRRLESLDLARWHEDMERFGHLNLRRIYLPNDQRIPTPADEKLDDILARMGKLSPKDELNCGACGYDTCMEHAIAIYKGLAETEMCLPYTIEKLRHTIKELASSNEQLASTQEALIQAEKLASMGQLAAGIAHEVNNPLGVVLMYAHLMLEECNEKTKMREDLAMIAEQADRCKKIVAGLLHFARQNKVVRYPAEMTDLVQRALKTILVPDNITVSVEQLSEDVSAELDRDQVIQVLTNLISNAVAAMEGGGKLTIRISGDEHSIRVAVNDTGIGIPEQNLKKIFEPFFTTKQIGKGTGLGLAVTYGIVKMHSGDIRVESNANPLTGPTGTTFTVTLPRNERPVA
jgi:iron only hydrogenase large subunit-like protein/nitrogen-specific signal transduction histidine kinase